MDVTQIKAQQELHGFVGDGREKMSRLTKSLITVGAVAFLSAIMWYNSKGDVKFPDYKCTKTGPIINQVNLSDNIFRAWEDYNHDGKPDAQITYFMDRKANCLRKIRVVQPVVEENREDALDKDIQSYKDFRDFMRKRNVV